MKRAEIKGEGTILLFSGEKNKWKIGKKTWKRKERIFKHPSQPEFLKIRGCTNFVCFNHVELLCSIYRQNNAVVMEVMRV